MTRRALLSVSDRAGLARLARGLAALGFELWASAGTARHLAGAGVVVRPLEELTGFGELLGGRVKTLHPLVHAAILAREDQEEELAALGAAPFELVVVNLYPFARALDRGAAEAELWEEVDVGGVALLRAAAKNHPRVGVVADPVDYPLVLEELQRQGRLSSATRRALAAKAFHLTAAYDGLIASALDSGPDRGGAHPEAGAADGSGLSLNLEEVQRLRYGENPHQRALLLSPAGEDVGFRQLQGEGLSYTNLLDAEAAWMAALAFEEPAAVIVKHATPCGVAVGGSPAEAYEVALACDPLSAYGGVVAFNRRVDAETARRMASQFLEVLVAPAFEGEALAVLAQKARRRVLEADADLPPQELRSVFRGYLRQDRDRGGQAEWRVVSRRAPEPEEEAGLRFAWRVVRHMRSNAIVLARGGGTVGLGAGQMSRVDAVRLAVSKAGERAQGAVLASDAFFPFPDGVEEAAAAGVRAVVQPGGSIRDGEVVQAADRHGLAMVFTGQRAFRH